MSDCNEVDDTFSTVPQIEIGVNMKGFPGGIQNFLMQAQQMQAKVGEIQRELENQTFEGSSGGGVVTVTVTGANILKKVKIKPEVIDSKDIEMLEDLVLAATNDALKTAKDTLNKEMQKVTGGMNIPGLM